MCAAGRLRGRAGMDAGRAYNEFPLMGGQLVPEEYWLLWDKGFGLRNFFENTAAVQVGGVAAPCGRITLLVPGELRRPPRPRAIALSGGLTGPRQCNLCFGPSRPASGRGGARPSA